ncbi:KilA-N domain-containing protein [Pseudoalteromonas sp. CO325X]|uniref:KilA-N domain-containing protein n=1 Tax=Pseudoalteromonas sp. CO325X TaxID=1777262 RepID=UPI0010234784|nr:KilA-N domain-containing protein [Pseudoalteromonas sp. CO325X]RZF83730.1 KilA-N domain-containing protein [Pseudoalteromonas sp. CO325X]
MPNAHPLATITIANTPIPFDEQQRINLNALHKASGVGAQKRPGNWLRLDSTSELIKELGERCSDLSNGELLHKVRGGSVQGTFAHQLLAISYAGWISPAFQLQVNQVFLDTKRLKQPEQESIRVDKQVYHALLQESLAHEQGYNELQQKYIELLEQTVALHTRKLTTRAPNIPLNQVEHSKILNLAAKGLGYTAIAKEVGRSRSAVRNVIIANGGR